jgi:hypothetical protein
MNTTVPDIAAICEKKKTSFRAYLEASGIFDVLVKGMLCVCPESGTDNSLYCNIVVVDD